MYKKPSAMGADPMLVWDSHACLPLRPHDLSFLPQLERHRAAGTNVLMINIGYGQDGIEQHIRMLATFRAWISAHADSFRLIEKVEDIERARVAGQLAIGFDIEGANAIDDQLSLVKLYRDLGVRWMLLAYNRNNRAAGGCQDEDTGLTAFGRRLLEELASLGRCRRLLLAYGLPERARGNRCVTDASRLLPLEPSRPC
jgi:membrane dipeptidase